MIPGWFIILVAVLGWVFLMSYMTLGRDWVWNPYWMTIGIPLLFVVLIAVGYFYYGLPLFDWTTEPAVPVRVVDNE